MLKWFSTAPWAAVVLEVYWIMRRSPTTRRGWWGSMRQWASSFSQGFVIGAGPVSDSRDSRRLFTGARR